VLNTIVSWRLMYRVSSGQKALKELERTRELLGHALSADKCERYWKIPELWTCEATMRFEASSGKEQVVECLLAANRIANGWYVLGPHFGPAGSLQSFTGIFSKREQSARVQSLEWAEFGIGAGGAAADV
jgi:hypothetical protein